MTTTDDFLKIWSEFDTTVLYHPIAARCGTDRR
jgi:hypothetical protein